MSKESARITIIDPISGRYAEVNSDGELKVDTELTLSGDVHISNVKVATTDAGAQRFLRVDGSRNLFIVTPTGVALNVSGDVRLKDQDSATFADIEADSSKNALYVQSESLASELTLVGVSGDVASVLDSIATDELRVVLSDDTTPANKAQVYSTGAVRVSGDVNVVTADIQIGAVEIKDGDSDTRADVELDSAKNALFVQTESMALESTLSGISGDINDVKTAVEIIDDWDESDRAKVNPVVGQAGVAANEGVTGATVQRITLATDGAVATQISGDTADIKTAVELIDNAVDGNYLNTNVNMAGSDAAVNEGVTGATVQRVTLANDGDVVTQISGDTADIKTAVEIMDDWDETDRAKINPIVGQAGVAADEGVTGVTVPRITLATDGAVVTQISGDTADIKTAVELLDNAVDGNYLNTNMNIAGTDVSADAGNKDVQTQRVTLATDDTNAAAIKTATELTDDVVGTRDSAFAGKVAVIGGIARSITPNEMSSGDAIDIWFDTYGRQVVKGANLSTNSLDVSEVSAPALESGYVTMHDVTLDADPTFEVSSSVFIGDKNKIGFALKGVSVDGGNHPYYDFTYDVSPDNSSWVSGDIMFDSSGTDAPIATKLVSGDSANELCYLPMDMPAQYIRTKVNGVNVDGSNTIAVDVYMQWKKG